MRQSFLNKCFVLASQYFQLIPLMVSSIYYKNFKRDNKLWVFGEWMGLRCCDNCMYFANYVKRNHPEISVIWLTANTTDTSQLDSRIECYEKDSRDALNILKKAGVVFMSHGMADLTSKSFCYYKGAIVVNFWHGIAWKKIHLDTPFSNIKKKQLEIYTKLSESAMYVSPSDEYTKIVKTAFGCQDVNLVINAGYPRNVNFFCDNEINKGKERILETLRNQGILIDQKSLIIAYMPTFRKDNNKLFSFESLIQNDKLQNILNDFNAVIIQKGHFVTNMDGKANIEILNNKIINLPDCNPQDLLAASDLLVTDYSSCFFDYLLLDRPIVHYVYDYEKYAGSDRGLYYDIKDVACGDTPRNVNQLLDSIMKNLNNTNLNHDLRTERIRKYQKYASMDSNSIIYNCIIKRL